MLTIYSTYGSPGASTTALYLAAQYASSGRAVLLIDADSDAGSLAHTLGIQFTPGTASFLAGGKPVTAANLIEHAQDVVFDDLHVMPAPTNPADAAKAAEQLAQFGSELRDISDGEMAVIVDAGRLTSDARTSALTTCAAAVLVVTGDQTDIPSLEHLDGVVVGDDEAGPLGLAASVGPSGLTAAQWRAHHGLDYLGSVEINPERNIDLSAFMSRAKRKSRRFRDSVDKLAGALYEFACPAEADTPRQRLGPAAPADADPDADAADGDGADAAANGAGAAPPAYSGGPPADQISYRLPPESVPEVAAPDVTAPSPAAAPSPYAARFPDGDPVPYEGLLPADAQASHGGPVPVGGEPPGGEVLRLPIVGSTPPPAPAPDAPPAVPTGSFRAWAEHLFGEPPEAESDDIARPSDEGATA